MRKSPFQNIIRRLFAVSGNECAFPNCSHVLIDEDGDFIGQVCHIEAAEKGGERYNLEQSDEDRRSFENLMLLCYAHHIKTNDVARYPVTILKKMKSDHERRFQNSHYHLPVQHEEKIIEVINDKLDKIHLITLESKELVKEGNEINKDSNEKLSQLIAIVNSSTFAITTDDNKIHSEQLEFIKKFKKEGKYQTALTALIKFKGENWDKINHELKYKVLANIATILFDFGQKYEAANYLLELETILFESPEKLSYLCLAYSILGNVDEFEKLFGSARIHGESDINLWIAFIQTRGHYASLEDVVAEIPTTLLSAPEILFNLGQVFIDRDQSEKGFEFLDQASNSIKTDKEKMYLLGLIAEKKLVHFVTSEKMLFKGFSTDEYNLIEKLAADLLKSWHNVAGTEKATGAYHFLMNAGICYKALGRDKDAESALFEAWTLSHQFICFKNLLFHYFDTSQDEKARILFDTERYIKITDKEKVDFATCKARFFSLIKEPQNAINELALILETATGDDRFLALDLIALTYFDCGDIEKALSYSKQLIDEYPSRPEGYASLGIYYSRSDNFVEAEKKLDQAFEIAHELDQPSVILYLLGCEFANIGEHKKAARCFEQVVISGVVNGPFKKLLLQYFYLEDYAKAEAIAKEGKESINDDALINEVLFRCYVELERVDEAKSVLFDYLKIGKEDSLNHFRFIGANFLERNDNSAEACGLLVDISDMSSFSLEQRLGVASILLKHNKISEGLEIAYQARLDYYNSAKSHEQYLGCILQKSEEPKEIMFPETVNVDTGIYLQDRINVESLFFITDDERVSGTNILRSSDKLATQFLGKHVNDTIEMQNSIGPGNVLTITSIINKNVYAFRESLKLLETRFMGESSMIFGSVAPGNDGKGGLLEFIKDHLTKVKHQKEELYRLYENDSATIGMLSSFLGVNIVETWLEMVGSEKSFVKSYAKDETKELNSVISTGKPVVIDIISLLTNFYIFQDFLTLDNLNIKWILAKSTVEELVSYKESLKDRGPVTSIILDGELKKADFTQKDLDAHTKVIDTIIDWCKSSTVIYSPKNAHKTNKELQKIKDILGSSFFDTLVVAREQEASMLSDDERLKQVALGEHNIQSFSSYQCLVHLLLSKRLPEDDFIELVKTLIRSNYAYIPVSGKMLWELLYESDFASNKTFQQATRGLIIMSPYYCAQAISKFSRYVLLNKDIVPEADSIILLALKIMKEHPQVEEVRTILLRLAESDFKLLHKMKKHLFKLLDWTCESG